MKRFFLPCALFCAVCSLVLVTSASAQYRAPGTRTFVPSMQALGMGNAATAYPTARTALFYNPAHLTRIKVTRAPITMFGISAAISNNFTDQVDFYNDRLQPAIDQGLENLDEESEEALYDEVLRMAGSPTLLSGDVLFPSFVLNRGSYGFGGGVFVHTEATYSVEDAGAGVPGLDFSALADFMAVASGATDLGVVGMKNLSVGLTGKYTQRYVSLKAKPFDAIDNDESLYVLGASTLAMDLGVLYEAPFKALPGQFYLGLVMSDLALSNFDYRFSAYYVKNEEIQNDAKIADEIALAQDRYQLQSSYRMGISYVLPALAGPLKETALAIDYVNYDDPSGDSPMLAHLSMGVQTKLGNVLSLRTGLNQGYTTAGVGLQLSFARIQYAFYGTEMGRLPGQSPSWNHRVQLMLGSF